MMELVNSLGVLADKYKRTFPYLRLSITDACNFRCTYCLPNGYQKTPFNFLMPDEIERLIRVFVVLGTEKIRITGGEPTLRKDLPEIVHKISGVAGIKKIAMTTNGYILKQRALQFHEMGLTALNVSIDSLDRKKFHQITGHDKLIDVLKGLELARKAGFQTLKINTVLLKNVNDQQDDFNQFLALIKHEPISLRFIELMQTGDNHDYFVNNHVRAEIIRERLISTGFIPVERRFDDGPALEYAHPDYKGKIGLIAPYSKDFCKACNRLRVTARGDLRLCLFGEEGYSLRQFLNADDQIPALHEKLRSLLLFKKESHNLHQGITGLTKHLASLGG